MPTPLFERADILIPRNDIDMTKWSVIACDQHSSDINYWDSLDSFVGNAPSTLRLMLPEAYLDRDIVSESQHIGETMRDYISSGVFKTLESSYIYVERTLHSGLTRRGLIGVINLDRYDYSPGSVSPIRATEGTVADRLPPRIAVRRRCILEMPHVMVFVNDRDDILMSTAAALDGTDIYDFELNMSGGHIKGKQLSGPSADGIDRKLALLEQAAEQNSGGNAPVVFAIGDGNHSLAAAKASGSSRALVELVNIHDPAVIFEPIHRVIFGTDTADFINTYGSSVITIPPGETYARTVKSAEDLCTGYISSHGGKIDYIHDDETAVAMGSRPGCIAVLLPALKKEELFETVARDGVFPKKSFSIGNAQDKRYYLECRTIQ